MYEKTLISGGEWKVDIKYHIDDYVGEQAKQWLENRLSDGDDTQPFFFCLSFPGPHHPYDLEGSEYATRYRLEDMSPSESTYEDLMQKGPQYRNMDMYASIYTKDFSEDQFRRTKRSYYANMTLIDEKIGEVLDVLKNHNAYDETVIIYTSDHGDFMGDYGLVEKLQCLQDSLMRIPLFIKPPIRGFTGTIVEDLALNIDIAATCLEIAGGTVPNLVLVRNFYQSLPESMMESARIDGASDWKIFTGIVVPLSKPIYATVGLFYAVGYWNSYLNAILYLDDSKLWPIQVVLRNIVLMAQTDLGSEAASAFEMAIDLQSLRSATILISTLPILCVYPFVQKHFVKGIMLGSVKG